MGNVVSPLEVEWQVKDTLGHVRDVRILDTRPGPNGLGIWHKVACLQTGEEWSCARQSLRKAPYPRLSPGDHHLLQDGRTVVNLLWAFRGRTERGSLFIIWKVSDVWGENVRDVHEVRILPETLNEMEVIAWASR